MATLVKTVLAALVLLMILVAAKFLLEHHLAPSTSGIQGLLRQQQRIDIVLLGSSHTRQGYDVAELEKATGKSEFVVGYDGLDLVTMAPIVATFLADPAKRPQRLVIEANGSNLARAPEIQEPRVFFDAPPQLKLTLVRNYLRTHHGREAYLDMWTLIANRGSDLILTWPLVAHTINSLSYHGGYVGKVDAGVSPAIFPTLRVPILSTHANPDQVAALQAIVAQCRQAQVPLLFAYPPLPAPVRAQAEVLQQEDQFRALADLEHIPFYDGSESFPTSDPALFHDSNHLSTAGRQLYTTQFAEELKRRGW